jgi:hypothetical protein
MYLFPMVYEFLFSNYPGFSVRNLRPFRMLIFSVIVVKTTISIHVFCLFEIVPAQPLCLFHVSLIALEIGFILLVMLLYLSV